MGSALITRVSPADKDWTCAVFLSLWLGPIPNFLAHKISFFREILAP